MLATTLLSLAAVAPLQSEYHVDPILGSDANSGSAADPWRTVTHAASAAVRPAEILLAPGTYGTVSGETFPLTIEGELVLRSALGRDTVEVDAPAMEAGVVVRNGARLEAVTVTARSTGVVMESDYGQPPVEVVDVDVRAAAGALYGTGISAGDGTVAQCRVSDLSFGIVHWGDDLVVEDCVITGCSTGINVRMWYLPQTGVMDVRRCEVSDCTQRGIGLQDGCFGTPFRLRLEDSLVVRNGSPVFGGGIEINDCASSSLNNFEVHVNGCTVVDNRGPGIQNLGFADVTIDSSIVAGNSGGDIENGAVVKYTLVGDGSGLAGPGPVHPGANRSGDPRFVDAAAGDYTLRFDSPAVDGGARFGPDFTGRGRSVDGDLDLTPRPDMGALEHRTLVGPDTIPLGVPFQLSASGPAGGFTSVVVSHLGYASTGITTPYGRLFVEPLGAYRLAAIPTSGGAPDSMVVPAFTDPALVGTSTGFQALTRSAAAPAGAAFSAPVLVPIE
ncbi:MAG: right-handed parallel beta-helix repeat-containing protein [Planctomycetota bacterium]